MNVWINQFYIIETMRSVISIKYSNYSIAYDAKLKNVLIACSDNLRGISEAFKLAFRYIDIQKCVVHQIHNLLSMYDHVKEFTKDMKKIYKEISEHRYSIK